MNTLLGKTYTWSNLISKEEVEKLCEFIENNFSGYENPKIGANTQEGKYKKQISTVKLIELIKVKPFLSNLIDHAVNIANLDFGYITFDPDFDKPGSAIMFKSHLNHRVLPVTSGTRKSLTMFIFGPKFQ